MEGIASVYYRLAIWITRFVYLNFLWMTFTLLGLIIFGFMPATTGMFAVVRKWNQGDEDIPIFKLFWKTYKNEFLRSNGLGFLLAAIGYLLLMEFQILRTQDSLGYFIASYGVVAIMILYGIVILYALPVHAHFKINIFQVTKWALIIGIVHPLLTVFLSVSTGLIVYITWKTIPPLLIFSGGSVISYILTWGASKTFLKYEKH